MSLNIHHLYRKIIGREPRPVISVLLREVEELLEEHERPIPIIVSAPTSYGKSSCTQVIAEALTRKVTLAERLIHVLPLRAITEHLYDKAKENERLGLLTVTVGIQAMQILDVEKSPFFLPQLIYTTIDSFVYNLFKLPVNERIKKESHFDLTRYSIYSSFVVFDEVHLFSSESPTKDQELKFGEDRLLTVLCSSIEALTSVNVPVILMTATMPRKFLATILRHIRGKFPTDYFATIIEYAPELEHKEEEEDRVEIDGTPVRLIRVGDKEFFAFALKTNASFEGFISLKEVPEKVRKELSTNNRVLVVHNTVEKVLHTADKLCRSGYNPVILHGKLTSGDRREALNRIDKLPILVSTQVIEAGVDLDYDVLITDATPITSLTQRVGRLARRSNSGQAMLEEKFRPRIYIIGGHGDGVYHPTLVERTIDTIKKLHNAKKQVGWRLPLKNSDYYQDLFSYAQFIEHVYEDWSYTIDQKIRRVLMDVDSYWQVFTSDIKKLRDKMGDFVREEGLITLGHIEEFPQCLQKLYERLLPVSLSFITKHYEILDISDEGTLAIIMNRQGKISTQRIREITLSTIKQRKLEQELNKCMQRLHKERKTLIALAIAPGKYRSLYGLIYE